MKISNIGYSGDFSRYLGKSNCIFIFENESDRKKSIELFEKANESGKSGEIENNYENEVVVLSGLSEKQNIFIFMNELKEKLFYQDKVVLKEEKEQILFYEILDEYEKNFFKIKNYFDSIDIASSFLNFYKELKDWNIESLVLESRNKKKIYEVLESVKKKYKK